MTPEAPPRPLPEPVPPPAIPAPRPYQPVPAGWEGILDRGETILWQGRPDASLTITPAELWQGVFGLAFAGFAAIWIILAMQTGSLIWMFGLIHFTAGLYVMTQGPLGTLIRRRRSWYTLTDRRAFIATDLPRAGRSLTGIPLTATTLVDFTERGDFATITLTPQGAQSGAQFERLRDGRTVLALIRRIQTGGG